MTDYFDGQGGHTQMGLMSGGTLSNPTQKSGYKDLRYLTQHCGIMTVTEFLDDGYWWLPEDPETRIPGRLEYNQQSGSRLTLSGFFKKEITNNVILGTGESCAEYTLENCLKSSTTNTHSGYSKSIFHVSTIYKGHLFQNLNELLFNKLLVNFSNLNDWLNSTRIAVSSELNDGTTIQVIKVLPSKKDLIHIPNGIVEISCWASGSFGLNEVSIKNQTNIIFSLQTPLAFSEFYQQYIRHFQNYLSLGLGKPVYPLEIIGLSDKITETYPDKTEQPKKITIYSQFYPYPENFPQIYPFERLFSYNDIKESFEHSFNLWMGNVCLLEPVFDLYFGTLYNDKLYLQSKFLNLTQAIESYHRRKFGGLYIDSEKNEELSKILLAALPEDIDSNFRESIKGRLRYINEFSQRKRLRELIKLLQEGYGDAIKKYLENTDQFIDDIVATRNYNTHFDEDLKESAKDGFELFVLTEKLKFLIEICLLSEIGLSNKLILDLINRSNKYQFLISYRQWNPESDRSNH